MLIWGLVGTSIGVDVGGLLRKAGLFEVTVSLSYVTFLGVVGTLIVLEGPTPGAARSSRALHSSARRSGQHTWVHRLPLKMRFHRSKLYITVSADHHRHVYRLDVGDHGHRGWFSYDFREIIFCASRRAS